MPLMIQELFYVVNKHMESIIIVYSQRTYMKMTKYFKKSHGIAQKNNERQVMKRNMTFMDDLCVSEGVHFDLAYIYYLRTPIHDML